MKETVRRFVPLRLRQLRIVWREKRELAALERLSCDTSALIPSPGAAGLCELFASSDLAAEWREVEPILSSLEITDTADGVNPGDRRAIFYLLRTLGPLSALEIGTHVGASTVHVGTALVRNRAARPSETARMTSVDIVDVNDEEARHWQQLGSKDSPRQMVARLGMGDWIEFTTRPSLEYLAGCCEKFDFIFLDGDHSAPTVYREIPAALRLLNRGGAILLHDYFPRLRPLWNNGVVIPGPWLAAERLRTEGAPIEVLPLGELPWATKLDSRSTSLALVTGRPS